MPADPGDITCGEWGTPEPERWSSPVALADSDRSAVAALEARRVLETQPAGALLRVAGTDQVGLIVLPSGRSMSIRPKIGGLVLLDWLVYVGDCPPVSRLTREGTLREGGPHHHLLAGLFLEEMELVTRRHMGKGYATERSEAAMLRGRVLVQSMVRSYHRLPSVPQARRARSLDTPHNRLLAAALDLLPPLLAPGSPARPRLAALRNEWVTVPRAAADTLEPAPDLLRRCPPGYAAAVQLAGLILRGFTRHPRAGACGEAFLTCMASVWERALRKMCLELTGRSGWAPVPEARRTRPWHDGQARRMTADVVLESPAGARWVLDAKYKCGYGDEGREDRFQACTYAVAFEAGRGTLVYPTAQGVAGRARLLLSGHVGARAVTIESIELPMEGGPEVCRAALLELLGDAACPSRFAEEPHC